MSSRYFATVRRVTWMPSRLQSGRDLLVGQRMRRIFFFDHLFNTPSSRSAAELRCRTALARPRRKSSAIRKRPAGYAHIC